MFFVSQIQFELLDAVVDQSTSFISRHNPFDGNYRGNPRDSRVHDLVLHASPESDTGFLRTNERQRKRERGKRNDFIKWCNGTYNVVILHSVIRATSDSLLCPLLLCASPPSSLSLLPLLSQVGSRLALSCLGAQLAEIQLPIFRLCDETFDTFRRYSYSTS